jgi:uncharacterized protein YjaZ
MEIEAIDGLTPLRAVLQAPAEQQDALFRSMVMEPLRPAWEVFAMMRGPLSGDDPAMEVARGFSLFRPECGAEKGLRALDQLDAAGSWPGCQDALRRAGAALDPASHGIPLERVRLTLVLADPGPMEQNPKMGDYTGFGGFPGLVWLQIWPNDASVRRLPAITAHELHHNVRFSFEPFHPMETTVGQYAVAEGLAEAFAAELYGEEALGPWARALTPEQLTEMRPRFREGLEVTGFNVIRAYIFGDWSAEGFGHEKLGISDFAGYSVGYALVKAFMQRTGTSAAEATYLPWQQIVEESRYL